MTQDPAPHIDEEALLRLHRLGGDTLVLKVIDICLAQIPAKIQTAWSQLRRGDIQELGKTVHSIKSTAGNIGASEIWETAEQIEELTARNQGEGLEERLVRLEESYSKVQDFLEEKRRKLRR